MNCTRTPRNTEASPSTLPVNEDEVMRACGLDMLTPLDHEVRMISSPVIICQPASTHAMSALPTPYISPEDYLELERRAPTKSQYFKGEIFAMAGASERHISIVANITSSFVSQLKGRPCKVYPTDMRVRVAATGLYTYPDIVVLCGAPRFDDKNRDTLLNPVVIFEILSKSTESYDRGAKFEHYRTLDSLTDYVLVSQDKPLIEHFARQPGDKWLLSAYSGLDAVATITSIACDLAMADVYDKVDWPDIGEEPGPFLLLREEDAFEIKTTAARPG